MLPIAPSFPAGISVSPLPRRSSGVSFGIVGPTQRYCYVREGQSTNAPIRVTRRMERVRSDIYDDGHGLQGVSLGVQPADPPAVDGLQPLVVGASY